MRQNSISFLITIGSVVVFMAVFLLLLSFISFDSALQQKKAADRRLVKIEATFKNTLKILKQLNEQNQGNCTELTLLRMRQALFQSQAIKDIGYFSTDHMLCTTGIGMLETPFSGNKATLSTDDFDIWIKQDLMLFDHAYDALIIKHDRFNAVMRPEDFHRELSPDYEWDLSLSMEHGLRHILGTGLLSHHPVNPDTSLFSLTHTSTSCSHDYPICITSHLSPTRFAILHHSSLILATILSVVSAFCGYFFSKRWMHNYLSLSSRIIRGFRKGCFYVNYQPIVSLSNGHIIGCEALARYQDELGPIYPDQFLPIIKQHKLTWQFTDFIIKDTVSRLRNAGKIPEGFRLSVNLFPQDIAPDTVAQLVQSQYFSGLPVQPILEIIEDEELHHAEFRELFQTLSKAGYLIAIDDFGTGYSSLSQLKKTECHILKMDRSFVNEIEEGSVRSSLVPHIVSIAKELHTAVVAEGIENEMQRAALQKEGIEFGQGWAFGKPMSAAQLTELIRQPRDPERSHSPPQSSSEGKPMKSTC